MELFFHATKISTCSIITNQATPNYCIGRKNKLYSYGGQLQTSQCQMIQSFDLIDFTRKDLIVSDDNKTEAPPPDQGFRMVYVEEMNSLFVLGGQKVKMKKGKVKKIDLSCLYLYDLEMNVWKRLKDAPRAFCQHGMVVRRDFDDEVSIIAFGGIVGDRVQNEMYEYFISQNVWKKVVPTSTDDPVPSSRRNPSMVYSEPLDCIMLYGGQSDKQFMNDLWRWNCLDLEWEQIQFESSPPRTPGSATLLGNFHLVVYEFTPSERQYLHVLDLKTNTWSKEFMEGFPIPKSFYSIERMPDVPMLLLIGDSFFGIECFQKLPTIEEISAELQTNVTSKDVIIHFTTDASSEERQLNSEGSELSDSQQYKAESYSRFSLGSVQDIIGNDDDILLCHKLILIQSPVLKKKIENIIHPAFQKTIAIDINHEKSTFCTLVTFLYGAKPNLTIDNVMQVMATAKAFEVDTLYDYCLQNVFSMLTVDNCITLMKNAHESGLTLVEDLFTEFVMDHHYLEMLERVEFSEIPSNLLHRLMKIREGLLKQPGLPVNLNSITNPHHLLMKHFMHIKKFGICHDFVIRSNDGRSFRCHQAIITLRSPYFVNIVKSSKTNKHIFNGTRETLNINGKLLSLIIDDLYGTFVPMQGNKLAKSLSIEEMKEIIEYSKIMSLYSLIKHMISQLSIQITEENAIEVLEFAVRLEKDLIDTPVKNNRTLRQVCMSMIRKPQSDLEYSLMMTKFFEAKHQGDLQPEKHFSPTTRNTLNELTSQFSETFRYTQSNFEGEQDSIGGSETDEDAFISELSETSII